LSEWYRGAGSESSAAGLTVCCSPAQGGTAFIRGKESLPLQQSKIVEPCVGVQQRVRLFSCGDSIATFPLAAMPLP